MPRILRVISKQLLLAAGGLSCGVAVFQALITVSPSWSLYFGAPEELVANTLILYISGWAAALVFAVFGLYALSGLGYIRSLPFPRLGLLGIGGVYTLRGLAIIPQILTVLNIYTFSIYTTPQGLVSSLVSLVIGLVYLAGTISAWPDLPLKSAN